MVDGHGDPNSDPSFERAIESLYRIAYRLKFFSKRTLERDYVVPPLEGLWWAEDPAAFTSRRDPSRWHWTLMLMVPDWITDEVYAEVLADARAGSSAAAEPVRFALFEEGLCAQTLHTGPFSDEGGVLEKMHQVFIPGNGLSMHGKHHEIYLSDFRRTAPEKRRTILRQPVRLAPAQSVGSSA